MTGTEFSALASMTPMYRNIWKYLFEIEKHSYANTFSKEGPVRKIISITSKLGFYYYIHSKEVKWLHICHPYLLHGEIKVFRRFTSTLAIERNTGHNFLNSEYCKNCGYELKKEEYSFLKLYSLGLKL